MKHNLWLIYNAAMERIVYDGKPVIHPASFPGMEERTIIVGSLSKEYCMIGWRVGWVAGPQEIMNHIGRFIFIMWLHQPGLLRLERLKH
ncbi:MAG: aminotransferase class I/II-fold pyridoxal phosphate-dependent enzyme [Bacteroidia bacterium]